MFGKHFGRSHDGKWAGPHGWRGHFGPGAGRGGRHGKGGDDFTRARRMLAQGDLKLIALALIAEQPRHGYELIKVLEDKTAGWYSPSPGIIYPTLTYLEEAGYVTGQVDGSKKLYTITDEGRAYLGENREFVDAVLGRLARAGEKMARVRRRFGGADTDDEQADGLPTLVKAALENLREVAAKRLAEDGDAETIVEALARAAADLRKA
jgi:DNA-binding PadR family transcriptional regulator